MDNNKKTDGFFSSRLSHHRRKADISQDVLAERSGVTQTQISKLERGVFDPKLPTIRALAGAMGVPTEALVSEAEPGHHPDLVTNAVKAGQAAHQAGELLQLPQNIIEAAEAQAIGRAVTTGRSL